MNNNMFVYNTHEFSEYYRQRGVTLDNLHEFPKMGSTIRSLLTPFDDEKTVFLPYYGEFGTGITRYVLRFHYTNAKHKIACIPHGYECLFPDAKEFIYQYPGPKWNEYKGEKWLYNNGRNPRRFHPVKDVVHTKYARKCFVWDGKLKEEFSDFIHKNYSNVTVRNLVATYQAMDPITNTPVRTFAKIPFKNPNKYGIKVDVVFANRKNDTDVRSFQKWGHVVNYLKSKGFTVGGIGKKGSSFEGLDIVNSYDYENTTEAGMEMLHNAKYYIGTDTGITHIAMNFVHLKSLLFRMRDHSDDWIQYYENENTRIVRAMGKTMKTFNNETILYKNIDEFFV